MLDMAQYISNLKNRIIHVYWKLHPQKAKIKNNNEIQPLHLLKPKILSLYKSKFSRIFFLSLMSFFIVEILCKWVSSTYQVANDIANNQLPKHNFLNVL